MSEKTERAIKNGQSRETGNKTKKNKAKTQHNLEKLATQGTQDEDKQNKNTTQYVFDTTMRKETQIT